MVKLSIKLVSFILAFSLIPSVCFAHEYRIQAIVSDMKNESANLVSEYTIDNVMLAKILRDAHIVAIPYNVNLETVNNIEKLYIDLQCHIADLKGDFSSLSKKQIADIVLLSTSFANDAECISGYSVISELLGDKNITKIKEEGIKSVCMTFTALTCHDSYKKISQTEQKQLLDVILNYDYDNISDITNALIAINNIDTSNEIQNFKNKMLTKIIDFYQNNDCSTQQIANIVTSAVILGIDVGNDSRLIKQEQTIIDVLYQKAKTENSKQKQWIEDIMTAFICYETKQSQYHYDNYNLKQNNNKITTEVYQYLLNESDISKHWAKNNFMNMILNGSIYYDYDTEKKLSPNDKMTRGEFISFIVKSQNIENSSKEIFSDIAHSAYKNEINSFMENYVTNNFVSVSEKQTFLDLYFGENFRPNDYITREEAAFFIKCASGYANKLQLNSTENLEKFADYKDCDEKYIDVMEFCVKRGFISGQNGKLLPKEAITKAETITLITHFNAYP